MTKKVIPLSINATPLSKPADALPKKTVTINLGQAALGTKQPQLPFDDAQPAAKSTPAAPSADAPQIKVTAVPAPNAAAAPVIRVAPPVHAEPKKVANADSKVTARAELARVYAGILGVEALTQDIQEAMSRDLAEGEKIGAKHIAAGLKSAGLKVDVRSVKTLSADQWPALAQMTSGQFVLVLSQSGGNVVIYDTTCTDNKAEVPITEFRPYFANTVIQAEAAVASLSKSHIAEEKQPHWFWGQFGQYRRQVAEVALGSMVANLLAVSIALFSLQVYDRVIPHQSEATLWVLAAGAFAALLMESLLKISRSRLMDSAGRQIELKVQAILMDRLLGMRSDTQGRSPTHLFSAMREFGSVREFFTATTIGTIADIPFLFVFLFLVASIAGNVVYVLIAGGLLMVIPGFLLQKRMIRLTNEMQGASTKASRVLQEVLFELDTVKTLRAEDRFRRIWSELTALSALKSSDQRKLASALSFWSQGIQQATYVIAVVVGTYLVFAGEFTVGSIIAVGILTSRTLAPLTQLSSSLARWGNVKSALDGLDAIAASAQDQDETRTYLRRETIKGQFELREIEFKYDDDTAAVLDIPGVMIQPGQRLAILGTNGSGKSTLLKLLSGLYAPTKGRIMLDGTEMSQIEPRDLRRLIGYLGQDVRLFSGTLRENLNLTMLERNDERLMEALDFAGLGQYVRSHPKGLDLPIADGGVGLSIGQRQSVGWARIWLQDPKVVLLDEPTAALDQTLETALVGRLEKWLEGRTAMIATHRVPILSLTTRTLILQNGRMTIDGPREQVMAHLTRVGGQKGA